MIAHEDASLSNAPVRHARARSPARAACVPSHHATPPRAGLFGHRLGARPAARARGRRAGADRVSEPSCVAASAPPSASPACCGCGLCSAERGWRIGRRRRARRRCRPPLLLRRRRARLHEARRAWLLRRAGAAPVRALQPAAAAHVSAQRAAADAAITSRGELPAEHRSVPRAAGAEQAIRGRPTLTFSKRSRGSRSTISS